ncbi:hypothetical protein HN011_009582 [Eciton burchellii]|nr:hypothetical protein HN011_009582 [Eciton burchellii]
MLKTTVGENLQRIYKIYEGYPFVGIYELVTPVLLLRDLKLIKHILVKDFVYFQSRGIAANEHVDPLTANLINLSGPRWRNLRIKLTPAFTSGKIRHIFGLFTEISEKFKQFINQCAENGETVDIRDLSVKFTTEVIATCFFGLETNTMQNGNSEFRRMCKRVLDPSLMLAIKRCIRDYMPRVFKWLSISLNPSDVIIYFMRIVKEMIAHRQMNNVTRNDIMQVLMDLRYKKIQEDTPFAFQSQDVPSKVNDVVIDDKLIAAQVYIFFLAGFETSSTTMSFAMYELAANPEIQKKLYNEIQTVYEKHCCISYDAICEMEYLDRVIRETLRKYPPVAMTQRVCEESYQIPGTDVVIEKGTKVLVPIYAIHHDPLYYKNPDVFDPDRFLDENKKLRDNYAFLPFGDGPRICIGMRFAYMQTKIGLVTLIENFETELSEKTITPLQFEPTTFTLTSKYDIWLKIRRRQDAARNQS